MLACIWKRSYAWFDYPVRRGKRADGRFDFSFLDDIDFNFNDDIINYDNMVNDLIEILKDLYKILV